MAEYYLIETGIGQEGTLARVVDHRYSYLDLITGAWVEDPAVFDQVIFEASTMNLTLKQAKANVLARSSPIEPIWIEEVES